MISQGKAFMKNREKNKNKYEGFRQQKIETPVYDASQKVYRNTQITNSEPNFELIQSQNDSLSNYSNTFNTVIEKSQDYVNRISSSNTLLNKFIRFKNGTIAYVTNVGVAKPIGDWDTYQSLLGKNGCPTAFEDVALDWSSSYIEGSIIPLKPSLIVGPPMKAGESCGNEGKNIYVSSLISNNSTMAYQGCYQDANPSIMTFIGDVAPVQTDVSIMNGDFNEPVIATNTYQYITSSSAVPGWDFAAVILNQSDDWGFTKPYPVGPQCCSIQTTQHITTQPIQMSTGEYTLTFSSVGRNCCDSSGLSNPINVIIDRDTLSPGTLLNFQPPTDKWTNYSVPVTIYVSGMHTISFEGTWSTSDRSSALQGIRLGPSGTPASGSGKYTHEQCKSAAIDGGYQYFGLQYGNPSTGKGYCAVTNDSVSATKNGTSYTMSAGIPLWSSNTATGSGNTAALTIQGSLSVINSQGAAIFSTPGGSGVSDNGGGGGGGAGRGFSDGNPTPSNYVGCYADTGNRAMPNTSNGQYLPLDQCKQLAQDQNYNYYAMQNNNQSLNGWCAGSSDMNEIQKYGIATNCTRLSDGTIGGGGWSNAVYSITPPSNYFLALQDDGNLCLYKGTGPSDNQGYIWSANTQGQQKKPNPSFTASKGKFGKNYMKTGDTLAPGDFVGSSDGSIYLLMQTDGNLVLYTSDTRENCSAISGGGSDKASLNMGGQGATALYKMSEVGNPANLGKIGYVDKNSEIYMYPDNKIGLSNNYVKYPDAGSAGNDIPGAASSGGSLDDCKTSCNGLADCYGFEYHSSVKVCYPKDKNMYPTTPIQPAWSLGNGDDLYVREKLVKEGFQTAEIDTNKWKNYTNNNKVFDNSIVDSVSKQLTDSEKKELSGLDTKIKSFSEEIQRNNAEYSQQLASVNANTVGNTGHLNNYYDEYDKVQVKIKHSGTNLTNMNNMVSDTGILVIQQNAKFISYAMVAIILLIIAIKLLV
jgi:hypothetical protein